MSNQPSSADLFKAAVGERVFLWRAALKMSRWALAEKAGVSTDYICRLERGRANPRLVTLQALAAALDTSVHELLDVSGDDLGMAAQRRVV